MRRYLLALTCLTTLLTGVSHAATAVDQVAVIVNDGVILKSDIQARMGDLRFQAQQRGADAGAGAEPGYRRQRRCACAAAATGGRFRSRDRKRDRECTRQALA